MIPLTGDILGPGGVYYLLTAFLSPLFLFILYAFVFEKQRVF